MPQRREAIEQREPQRHRGERADQADDGEHRDLLEAGKRRRCQRRVADQRGGEPQGDGGHHEGEPLSTGDSRGAECRGAVVQAVVDRHADQARAEQQGGDVDLPEDQKGAGEGDRDADAQRQQIEQQRRQAAKDADDQQDGAGDLDDRQHRHLVDRRARAVVGKEDRTGPQHFHVRHLPGDRADRVVDRGDQLFLDVEVEGIVAKGHRHDHPGRRRIHDGQHAVVEGEASQRVRQRREERRQQQKRIGGKQRRVDRTAEAEGLRQGALREILAATVIQRPSVGGAQQGVAIGKVEGGEGPAGVLQGRTVERIDQPRGGDGGCRLLGGRAGASAIGVAEDQHDAATEAARHGLGGKLRHRVLLLARQQRQQIGPDGKAGHAQDRQVDGGRGDDREPERRQDTRHGRLAVSSSSLASASSGARDGACWLNSMRSQSPLVRITSTEST